MPLRSRSALKNLPQTANPASARLPKTIAVGSGNCFRTFERCSALAATLGPRESALIQNQLARFSLWTSSIGVFAPERASLDYRLQEVDDVHRLVRGLLESLDASLGTCCSELRSLSSRSEPEGESQKRQEDVTDVVEKFHRALERSAGDITLLHQLSNTIRRAGTESRNSKAMAQFEIKDCEGNNMEKVLEDIFVRNLADQFPGCDENLCQRLASTMVKRRKRILYRRSRQDRKPRKPPPQIQQVVVQNYTPPPKELVGAEDGPEIEQPQSKAEVRSEQTTCISSERSAKTTTTLDPEMLRPKPGPSMISIAKSIPLSHHDDLVFPPPPRASVIELFRECKAKRRKQHQERLAALPGYSPPDTGDNGVKLDPEAASKLHGQIRESESIMQKAINHDWETCNAMEMEVVCPYCFWALSSSETKRETKWREHVKNDLDPYVCLFANCESAEELYSHSEPWLKHMRQHAVRWSCMARSHGTKKFDRREEYEDHMREAHQGAFSEPELLALADRNARMMGPLFPSCPLCGATENDEKVKVAGRLEDHVVGHLRYLALKSLPRVEEEHDGKSSQSAGSDDSAKPVDRSTLKDFKNDLGKFEIKENDEHVSLQTLDQDGNYSDPYADCGGIEDYISTQVSWDMKDGGAVIQWHSEVDLFSPPEIKDFDKSTPSQSDESSRFVSIKELLRSLPKDKPHEIRQAQWGWMPNLLPEYHGLEEDPKLLSFRNRASGNSHPGAIVSHFADELAASLYSPPHGDAFVPISALNEILTKENIETILKSCSNVISPAGISPDPVPPDLFSFIPNDAARCFAILLSIGQPEQISDFQSLGFTDAQLPIAWNPNVTARGRTTAAEGISVLESAISQNLYRSKNAAWTVFGGWETQQILSFCSSQWRFLAPVFNDDKFEYALEPSTPMPFFQDNIDSNLANGSVYNVYEAVIHSAHMDVTPRLRGSHNSVLIKEVNYKQIKIDQALELFYEESSVLYTMRNYDNRHMIKTIAAFKRGDIVGFIFPRSLGNLQDFWRIHDLVRDEAEMWIDWMFRQLRGIVGAIELLHGKMEPEHRCSHENLTPRTILWFPSDVDRELDILVIGGLSLTRMELDKVSGKKLRYAKPRSNSSMEVEMYAIVCISLEFIIWLTSGYDKLVTFQSETPTGFIVEGPRGNSSVHPAVKRQVEKLMTDERCTSHTPLGDLLRFAASGFLLTSYETKVLDGTSTPDFKYELGRLYWLGNTHQWLSNVCRATSRAPQHHTAVYEGIWREDSQKAEGLMNSAISRWLSSNSDQVKDESIVSRLSRLLPPPLTRGSPFRSLKDSELR
ncbi:hypothetical protein MAJ_08107, partial [Metarhizium majus ARSEF 297]